MASKLTGRHASQIACRDCSLSSLCLPLALEMEDIDKLDSIIKRGRPLKKGEHLFVVGDQFHSVFAVRSGVLKTYASTNEGEEQITGFYLPSDMVGLSGLDTDIYPVSAQAIETTMICEIPFDKFDLLAASHPTLRRQLMRAMSRRIREDQQMQLLLSRKSADERIATFLNDLAIRFGHRGFSFQFFRLAMSRYEIANYLGLAVETVSRVFTRFQKAGLIRVNGREVEILDASRLRVLAGSKTSDNSETADVS